jgi:hypothetical protein
MWGLSLKKNGALYFAAVRRLGALAVLTPDSWDRVSDDAHVHVGLLLTPNLPMPEHARLDNRTPVGWKKTALYYVFY